MGITMDKGKLEATFEIKLHYHGFTSACLESKLISGETYNKRAKDQTEALLKDLNNKGQLTMDYVVNFIGRKHHHSYKLRIAYIADSLALIDKME